MEAKEKKNMKFLLPTRRPTPPSLLQTLTHLPALAGKLFQGTLSVRNLFWLTLFLLLSPSRLTYAGSSSSNLLSQKENPAEAMTRRDDSNGDAPEKPSPLQLAGLEIALRLVPLSEVQELLQQPRWEGYFYSLRRFCPFPHEPQTQSLLGGALFSQIKPLKQLIQAAAHHPDPQVFLALVDQLHASHEITEEEKKVYSPAFAIAPARLGRLDILVVLERHHYPLDFSPTPAFATSAQRYQNRTFYFQEETSSPLLHAIRAHKPTSVRFLLDHGAQLAGREAPCKSSAQQPSPLFIALQQLEQEPPHHEAVNREILAHLARAYFSRTTANFEQRRKLIEILYDGYLLKLLTLKARENLDDASPPPFATTKDPLEGLVWLIDHDIEDFNPWYSWPALKTSQTDLLQLIFTRAYRVKSQPRWTARPLSNSNRALYLSSVAATADHAAPGRDRLIEALQRYFVSPQGRQKLGRRLRHSEHFQFNHHSLFCTYEIEPLWDIFQLLRAQPSSLSDGDSATEFAHSLSQVFSSLIARSLREARTLDAVESRLRLVFFLIRKMPQLLENGAHLREQGRERLQALFQAALASLKSPIPPSSDSTSAQALRPAKLLLAGLKTIVPDKTHILSLRQRDTLSRAIKGLMQQHLGHKEATSSPSSGHLLQDLNRQFARELPWVKALHPLGLIGAYSPAAHQASFRCRKTRFLIQQAAHQGAAFGQVALAPIFGDCVLCGEQAEISCSAAQVDCLNRLCASCKRHQLDSLFREDFGYKPRDPTCQHCKQPVRISAFVDPQARNPLGVRLFYELTPATTLPPPLHSGPSTLEPLFQSLGLDPTLSKLARLAYRYEQKLRDPQWRPCPTESCPSGQSFGPQTRLYFHCSCCGFQGCLECQLQHGPKQVDLVDGHCLIAAATLSPQFQALALKQGARAPLELAQLPGSIGDTYRNLSETQQPLQAAHLLTDYLTTLAQTVPQGATCPICQETVGETHQIPDHTLDGRNRPCPHCGVMVEKIPHQEGGACNHMICPNPRCQKDFNFNRGKTAPLETLRSHEPMQYPAGASAPWWQSR